MSNLQMRIITAACLLAISLTATWVGGVPFRLVILGVGAAIYHEWQILTIKRQTLIGRKIGWCCYAIIAILLVFDMAESVIFSFIFMGSLLLGLLGRGHAGWQVGGFLYALAAPVILSFIREREGGLTMILFLYAVVWATDSAAYFSGRFFGGPKLVGKISPNKTWSGAIGGVLAALAAALILTWWRPDLMMPVPFTILAAFVLCVVAQAGDIGESWLKRYFNVKDSGAILPGHGGFMDRADGLIASTVFLYLIIYIL